jgi:hypothetical protein
MTILTIPGALVNGKFDLSDHLLQSGNEATQAPSTTSTHPPTDQSPSQPASQVKDPVKLFYAGASTECPILLELGRRVRFPGPDEASGWYVVFRGTVPGVCRGA